MIAAPTSVSIPAPPPVSAGATRRCDSGALLRQHADMPVGHPGHAALRARRIEAGLPLARRLAARYTGRGEPFDDLYQVAALALVKAVDGYQPARQVAFTTYAVPTIVGALKRHFRDATWRVRVPRRIKELTVNLAHTDGSLAQHLGRTPTSRELAIHLQVTDEDVAIARSGRSARYPDSLDAPTATDGEGERLLSDTVGAVDPCFDAIIDRHVLRPLLAALTAQQRRILALRYGSDLTQAEIAAQVGVSQMQISRVLQRILTQLHTGMLAE